MLNAFNFYFLELTCRHQAAGSEENEIRYSFIMALVCLKKKTKMNRCFLQLDVYELTKNGLLL